MSRKRKGKYTLSEALDLLEATTAQDYPDNGTGIAGDDDRPPGNIVYGEKYKRTPYFNKLTDFQDSWEVDLSDWTWDEFEMSGGMEDKRNYSTTLKSMKDLFPKETWNNVWKKRMKFVSKAKATKGFKDAGQPWRKGGEDQTGNNNPTHMEVDIDKGGSFKDSNRKDFHKKDDAHSKLTNKIDNLVL
jgi:hypothetical protein